MRPAEGVCHDGLQAPILCKGAGPCHVLTCSPVVLHVQRSCSCHGEAVGQGTCSASVVPLVPPGARPRGWAACGCACCLRAGLKLGRGRPQEKGRGGDGVGTFLERS